MSRYEIPPHGRILLSGLRSAPGQFIPVTAEEPPLPLDLPTLDRDTWAHAFDQSSHPLRVSKVEIDTDRDTVRTEAVAEFRIGGWVANEVIARQGVKAARALGGEMLDRLKYEAIKTLGITVTDVLNQKEQ